MGKAVKKVVKKVTKSVKKLVKAANPLVPLASATGYLFGKALGETGGIIAKIPGLEKVGEEIDRISDQIDEVSRVVSGQYHNDAKNIQEYQNKVEKYKDYVDTEIDKYNSSVDGLIDKIDRLIAFDEIFKMAAENRLDNYIATASPEINALIAEYNRLVDKLKEMIKQLKNEYDFVIGLTKGNFYEKIIGSIFMIFGGIASDMNDILNGKANSNTWKNLITVIVMVIVVVLLWWNPAGWSAGTVAVMMSLSILNAFLTLDGMYANGAATGAIMGVLDFIFNDLLNLDDLIGSDFDHFDKDNKDYQDMVGYVKLAITLAQIIVSWSASSSAGSGATSGAGVSGGTTAAASTSIFENGLNIGTASTYGTEIGSQQTAMLAAQDAELVTNVASYGGGLVEIGDTLATSSVLGVKLSSYSDIYKAYSAAKDINDVVAMNDQFEQMKAKLQADYDKLNVAIQSKTNKNFMKHYKDTAYFLQDQQEFIDRYIWNMTAESMYVDPYGTTPVANMRFTPDSDTRVMSFGFEDVFDENRQAGSRGYFNNILYGMG